MIMTRLSLLVAVTWSVTLLIVTHHVSAHDASKEVAVQKAISVSVEECEGATVPSTGPLKTRVVVVHNNMVPVPIECFLPPDSGTCSKDLARVYYDHETRTCKPFSYTGCGGNANRFQSIKNCYRICHPYRYKIKPKIASKRPRMSCPQPNYRAPPRVPSSCGGDGFGAFGGGGGGGGYPGGGGGGGSPVPWMGRDGGAAPGGYGQRPFVGHRAPRPYGPPGDCDGGGDGGGGDAGMMQPIVQKQAMGGNIQERVVGESYQPMPPENRGVMEGKRRKREAKFFFI